MSGPREPWRSRSLSKAAAERNARVAWDRFWDRMEGKRVGRDLPEDLSPIEPRETRVRDRALRGKARIRARRAAS
jgi:hypothetical protein